MRRLVHVPSPTSGSPTARGLRNQGATCYINSLIQVLFHIPAFRRLVFHMAPASGPSASLVTALQRLFADLQLLHTGSGDTTQLTASFGFREGDAFVQHDIHELTCLLLDKLETHLNDQPGKNPIRNIFGGRLCTRYRAEEVNYESSSFEPFCDVGLTVKGCDNIYDSLDLFFSEETLDGAAKLCVERDGKKSYHAARRRVLLQEPPRVLLFYLIRSDFDPQTGEPVKVTSRWEYYDAIDVGRHAERPDPLVYYLHGVVVHSGIDAGYGHYYCYTKSHAGGADTSWHKFNDTQVTPAAPGDVFGQNFGGARLNYWGAVETSATHATMLVYVRHSDYGQVIFDPRADAGMIPCRIQDEYQRRNDAGGDGARVSVFCVNVDRDLGGSVAEDEAWLSQRGDPNRKPAIRVGDFAPTDPLSAVVSACCAVAQSDPERTVLLCFARGALTTIRDTADIFAAGGAEVVLLAVECECPVTAAAASTVSVHRWFESSLRRIVPLGVFVAAADTTTLEGARPALLAKVKSDELRDSFKMSSGWSVFVCSTADQHPVYTQVEPSAAVANGGVYVWQAVTSPTGAPSMTVAEWATFERTKCTVSLASCDFRKGFATITTVDAAADVSFDDFIAACARALQLASTAADRLRVGRCISTGPDPPSGFEWFLRSEWTTLTAALRDKRAGVLYFDVLTCCTRSEAERASVVAFEYFDAAKARPVLRCHIVLDHARNVRDTLHRMRDAVVAEAAARSLEVHVPEWEGLRLLDVWLGRIYAVYDAAVGDASVKVSSTADYRLEPAVPPHGAPNVWVVSHYSVLRKGGLVLHGDPFYLEVAPTDTVASLRLKVATRMGLETSRVDKWLVRCITAQGAGPIQFDSSTALLPQLLELRSRDAFKKQNVVIGLEHAPMAGARSATQRREERALKLG
jgi:ubiquitin C-terminal hydrolase